MSMLKDLEAQWKNYTRDRDAARVVLNERKAQIKAQIRDLEEVYRSLTPNFDADWRQRKADIREARDNAALLELQTGKRAAEILREIGSQNTVWMNQLANSGRLAVPQEAMPEIRNQEVVGAHWEFSNHLGTHGVLRSSDGKLFKFYDRTGSDDWFVVSADLVFLDGSYEFYDSYPKPEIARLSKMLTQVLTGTYTGPVREADNPYKK